MGVQHPFVHLRVRSPYSVLEGAIRMPKMVEACQTYGMPAIALTDTNNLFGALEFSEVLSGAGVQPIVGCTLKLRLGDPHPGERAEPDGTLVLLAQDEEGYGNLMALSSAAFCDVDGSEEPHIPLARVLAHPHGEAAPTGGPGGVHKRPGTGGPHPDAARCLAGHAHTYGRWLPAIRRRE